MEKRTYKEPEISISSISFTDVIVTSNYEGNVGNGPGGNTSGGGWGDIDPHVNPGSLS